MGKSKAKKAVTTTTNQFFKPSANAHSPPRKKNALEDVTNIKRLKDVKSLKPVKPFFSKKPFNFCCCHAFLSRK